MDHLQTQMPAGWEIKKLGEVCLFGNGLWTGKKPPFIKVGVIRNTNFSKDGKLDDTEIAFLEVERSQFPSRKLQYGDIILEKSGGGPKQPVGRVIIFDKIDGEYSYSNFTSLIRIANPKIVDFSYLHKFLYFAYISGVTEKMQSHSTGIRNLKFDEYKNISILFPTLIEQQRIVSILDETFAEIDKAKANAERNLKNANELFEVYLRSIFENNGKSWAQKTLGEISKIFGRGKSKHRPRNFKGLYGGKYPFIQTGDIRNCNHYITGFSQTYNEVGLAQSKLWPKGTICITIAANIAETGILTFDACFPDSVIGIVVNYRLADINFVEYLLQNFKARIQNLGKGSAQANINLGTFENEMFPFPNVEEQKNIVQKLDALAIKKKSLEVIYLRQIEDLEALKKSLLKKAFAGELKHGRE